MRHPGASVGSVDRQSGVLMKHPGLSLDQAGDALPMERPVAGDRAHEGGRRNRRLPSQQATGMLRHFVCGEGEVIQA